MRVVFLNILNGQIRQPFLDFVKRQAPQADAFCFQECPADITAELDSLLADFDYRSHHKQIPNDTVDIATFIRRPHTIMSCDIEFPNRTDIGMAIVTQLQLGNTRVTLVNVHGISYHPHDDKLDRPNRLELSARLIDRFKDYSDPVIIGGDFNMLPEAKSVQTFASHGYADLIQDFGISTTRNRLIWQRYPNNPQKFADYIFLNRYAQALDLNVPDIEISDHLPLILDCQLTSSNSIVEHERLAPH